jgi:hypothetical protein
MPLNKLVVKKYLKSSNFKLTFSVAGLDIKSSGNFGGSTQVVIRGNSSIQVIIKLFLLMVYQLITVTQTADQTTGRGGYDYGNAASDIRRH